MRLTRAEVEGIHRAVCEVFGDAARARALLTTSGCARRLERSQKTLAGRFPLTAVTVASLSPDDEDDIDAFLKRFEQLVNALQDELFKAIAVLGALPSATTFRTLVAIRNRIAHVYPDDPERQARNLNEAYAAVGCLLSAHAGACRYLERRLSSSTAE